MKETLEAFLLRNHSSQTVRTYLWNIETLLLREPDAAKFSYNDVQGYLAKVKRSSANPGTILASLKRYFDYLVETGQRSDHPCKNVKLGKRSKAIQTQNLFTSAELQKLLTRENRFKHLELRNKAILMILIYQGLTSAEIVRLETDDLDLDEGIVYVKGSNKLDARTLPLKPNQIRVFEQYIESSRKELLKVNSKRLFITQRGVPETVDGINSMTEPLKNLFPDRILNPTTIRQSVICNWLNEDRKPLEDVQLLAGHKWPSATEKYLKLDIRKEREFINRNHPLA